MIRLRSSEPRQRSSTTWALKPTTSVSRTRSEAVSRVENCTGTISISCNHFQEMPKELRKTVPKVPVFDPVTYCVLGFGKAIPADRLRLEDMTDSTTCAIRLLSGYQVSRSSVRFNRGLGGCGSAQCQYCTSQTQSSRRLLRVIHANDRGRQLQSHGYSAGGGGAHAFQYSSHAWAEGFQISRDTCGMASPTVETLGRPECTRW